MVNQGLCTVLPRDQPSQDGRPTAKPQGMLVRFKVFSTKMHGHVLVV